MSGKSVFSTALLCLLLAIWVFPLLSHSFELVKDKPLQGYYVGSADTVLTPENWFEGRYAPVKEKYLNEHFGFRSECVRIRNQFYYSAFNKIFSNDVILGKEGYLYEYKYVTSYAGRDYLGDNQTDLRFEKLKSVQDSLAKRGVTLVLILAPGKVSYLPEYLPDSCNFVSINTNYSRHALDAKKYGINHIDMCKWFLGMKQQTPYPLYPKTATHWSVYARYLALDSINRYVEKKTGRHIPQYKITSIRSSEKPEWRDKDIEFSINLLFDLPAFRLAYPVIEWQDTSGAFRPRVLTVGDSYYGSLQYLDVLERAYSHPEFWPYNRGAETFPATSFTDTWQLDLKASVEQKDLIFIMATESNLRNTGWDFIEQLYDMYKAGPEGYPALQASRKKRTEMALIITDMTTDSKWLSAIKNFAANNHISLDSALQRSAGSIYSDRHRNDQSR